MGLRLDSCCCCIELRTGCLILGYIGLIQSILFGILIILGFAYLEKIINAESPTKGDYPLESPDSTMIQVVFIGLFIAVLIYMSFHVVFLVGVHKNKRRYVKCYMVFAMILTVMSTIAYITKFVKGADEKTIFSLLTHLAFQIYYSAVVRSYYYKMEEETRTDKKELVKEFY